MNNNLRSVATFVFLLLASSDLFAQQTTATQLSAQSGDATTQNTNSAPIDYNSNFFFRHKTNTALSLPLSANGKVGLLGFRSGTDMNVNKAHELAFSDDEILRIRSSSGTSWGVWRRILAEDNTGNVVLPGKLTVPDNNSYVSLGNNTYPHGLATLGHGSGNNALLYHYQIADGPTMKVDVDGNNASPVVHISGSGFYLNGALVNIDYTHGDRFQSTLGFRAKLNMTQTLAGGQVVSFWGDASTIAGDARGGNFAASTSGTGTAYGVWVDAYKATGGTGNTWGVYVNRGISYFGEKVGVGTTTPLTLFHANGFGSFGNKVTTANATRALNLIDDAAVMRILRVHSTNAPSVELISRTSADGSNVAYWDFYAEPSDASFRIRDRQTGSNLDRFTINHANGYVGIGTTNPQSTLTVNGITTTKKLVVTQVIGADYVFEPSYKLPTLKEVENYIKAYKHLPDVSSAKEMKDEGLDIGDNQIVLLKKIEELTLYIIDMQKQINSQQKTIGELKRLSSNGRNRKVSSFSITKF